MYQGHKNRTHWNVALYLYNDYNLYQIVCREIKQAKRLGNTLDCAAYNILDILQQSGFDKTPDGYRYSYTAIRAAIANHES